MSGVRTRLGVMVKSRFGARLRAALEEQGVLHIELAEFLRVHPSRVAKWLAGTGEPKRRVLIEIARFTGKSLRYWCDDDLLVDPERPRQDRSELRVTIDNMIAKLGEQEALTRLLWSPRPDLGSAEPGSEPESEPEPESPRPKSRPNHHHQQAPGAAAAKPCGAEELKPRGGHAVRPAAADEAEGRRDPRPTGAGRGRGGKKK
jgi:transcriptional regulator with XRE-family HTH domain